MNAGTDDLDPTVRMLLDSATDGVAVVDPGLALLHFNRLYCTLVGKRERELKRAPPRGHCHSLLQLASCKEAEGCIALRAVRTGKPLRMDEVASAAGNSYIVTAVPLLDAAGRPWAVVETYRDVTAEGRMQERYKVLLEAERQRNEALSRELDEARRQLLDIFAEEAREICERAAADLVALDSAPDRDATLIADRILRELHTLKGAAGSAGLGELASLGHISEAILVEYRRGGRPWSPRLGDVLLGTLDAVLAVADGITRGEDVEREVVSPAKERIDALRAGRDPRVGPRVGRPRRAGDPHEEMVRVPARAVESLSGNVAKLLDAVELGLDPRALRELLRETRGRADSLMVAPVRDLLEPFRRVVREQARKGGRQVEVEIVGGEVPVNRRLLDSLRAPLGHILRNAVDHGVESPQARQQAGKPPTATVRLEARRDADETVVLSVSDDGQGINLERVRAVAVERGLIDESRASRLSEKEALDLVWRPGFTTAQVITETSGRGVGLDAVREQIASLGATISLETTRGQGTWFIIRLPPLAPPQSAR